MTQTADHLVGLLPHHLAHLRESGLTDATIQAAGISSETEPQKIAAMLNRDKVRKHLAPAIVFPFTDADGRNGYCRIRPDRPRKYKNKPIKYESPTGLPNQVYLPPGVAAILDDSAAELLITEGEKKALAATQAGFSCIGLVGAWGWKPKGNERLLPELERVKWHGRRMLIVFDSDLDRNEDVQRAESHLAKHLSDRGARVRCVRLPDGPPDEDGTPKRLGADDFLVAYGAVEFRKLLDAAIEPEPLTGPECKQHANSIDPGDEGRAYLETWRQDDLSRLRFYRGEWLLHVDGCYQTIETAYARANLVRHLDKNYFRLAMGVTSNVLDLVKSHSILPSHREAPCWLGEPAKPWKPDEILATKNGLIHLPTLISSGRDFLIPPTPRFFCQSATDFEFDLAAPRPSLWLSLLDQYWHDDPAAIATLQEWYGLCLTNDTSFQKILLLIGPTRSGKGLIGRLQKSLVGSRNVAGPSLANLGTNFGLSQLLGKSLAIISDARLSGKSDQATIVERLLSISGEDPLTADRKNLPAITVVFPTRIAILSNELPRLHDSSGALAGRMLILRMTESFYGKEDRTLSAQLTPELPGILLWSIEGWRRLRARGRFTPPESGNEYMDELRELASPVGMFVSECCEIGPEYDVTRKDLYDAYRRWSLDKGRQEKHVEDQAGFGRALRAAVTTIRNSQPKIEGERPRFYKGIKLK
jgi:putative DNA primase/helicase